MEFGVSPSDHNLIHLNLTSRTQKTKINNSFIRGSIIEYGVP